MHGQNIVHLADYDHMKRVAEVSPGDMDVVDVLTTTAEHEKLHVGLHPHREALYQVVTGITGKAEDGHNAEEGAVSIKSTSRRFDAYGAEAELVGDIARGIDKSRGEVVDAIVKGKVKELEDAAVKKGLIEVPEVANDNNYPQEEVSTQESNLVSIFKDQENSSSEGKASAEVGGVGVSIYLREPAHVTNQASGYFRQAS